MPAPELIEKIVELALLSATEADEPFHQRLGVIHLIKHLYLADLAHAEHNQGMTLTGTDWIFHHFGPWSVETWKEVEGTLARRGAEEHRFPSDKFEGDTVRYSLPRNERRLRELERELPFWACRAVTQAVKKFGSDTSDLLHHVYQTRPMLGAAPSDHLRFEAAPVQSSNEAATVPSKKWKADHAALRLKFEEIRKAKSQAPSQLVPPVREPRYDQVFEEGVRVLNRLDDEPSSPIDAEVEFTSDVWHSPLRTDDGLP